MTQVRLETAQRLKAAGYPQRGMDDYCRSTSSDGEDYVYEPDLSELIDMLPPFFDFQLGYRLNIGAEEKKIWEASGVWKLFTPQTPDYERYGGLGDTPEAAVANLWLAINKK